MGVTERRNELLARGLAVLSAFERDLPLSNGELVARTGLPKATVSRLVSTLVDLGYLQPDAGSRKFVIGARMLGLTSSVQRHTQIQRTARPHMQRLAEELNLSVVLGLREGRRILLLEVIDPPRSLLRLNNEPGMRLSIADTSIGMACLVAAPLSERVKLLEEFYRRRPEAMAALRERVQRAHEERARLRFVSRERSPRDGLLSAACPLVMARRVFVVAAVGPSFELSRVRLFKTVGPALVDAVDRIARELGGSPASAELPARVSRRPER